MRLIPLTLCGCALGCAAFAGGIDRTGQSVAAIFEDGDYAEFRLGVISPNVSGSGGGNDTGNVLESYVQWSAAYKRDVTDAFSMAVIIDQPFGANTKYPTGTGYPGAGAEAELKTMAATFLGNYSLDGGFSIHGGVRAQSMSADSQVPFAAGYTGTSDTDYGFGYVVGVAYEKPEIAARVSLTYSSAIDHTFETTETNTHPLVPSPTTTDTDVSTPQSVNLEFQTGIMEDTLLFGSVRWVEWTKFDITPQGYQTISSGSLVSYDNDTITYSLGVGRRFSDAWSGAVTVGYEKSNGGLSANLGPTDGRTSVGVGATYTSGNMKLTGGLSYIKIGDANTSLGGSFTDNSAIAAGFKLGISL